jgi:hypothetical protein
VIDTATIRSLQPANPATEAGTGWIDPSTDFDPMGNMTLNSSFHRLPALKAQYSPSAKRNICVAYSHGINKADPTNTYNFMVSWLNALRSGRQNWIVVIGLFWNRDGSVPDAAMQVFNALVIANASSLNVSYPPSCRPRRPLPSGGRRTSSSICTIGTSWAGATMTI